MSKQSSSAVSVGEAKKGLQTKLLILQAALDMASKSGLEGLTIGTIADAVQMSKSGVFAHFGSREELQVAVVREYHKRFREQVFAPALSKAKGLPRLLYMLNAWLKMSTGAETSSCFFIAGAAEFDDCPGIVREELKASVQTWRLALRRAIQESVEVGHLNAATSVDGVLFQVYSIALGVHHDARFLDIPKSINLAKKLIKAIIAMNQSDQ